MKYHITAVGEYGFFLVLNPMKSNTESTQQFGPFPTREALMEFYNQNKVEPYEDDGPNMFYTGHPLGGGQTKKYQKCFRKGGPLEWCNPLLPLEFDQPGYYGHGVHEVLIDIKQVTKGAPLGY